MGRRRKARSLGVWMNGERVGEWRRAGLAGGQEFSYAGSWLESRSARPISLSLPLRPSREPYRAGVEEFFDNLLPDNRQIRERIQRRFQAASIGAFDLLEEIGRDCVGALQLLPENAEPENVRQIAGERLSAKNVAAILDGALGSEFGAGAAGDTFRISLAGAQEKTALLFHEGEWRRPAGPTPTTHILKLPLGMNPQGIDLSTSVENEWLCSEIVRGYGLEVARCRIEAFGPHKTLVIERFDRAPAADGSWIMRLPQEDFCQATATPPGLKYESDGGPGIAAIMELLLGSERAVEDRRRFMRAQLVFWMLAAIDGHAKNFSIRHLPGGAFELAPLYDILSAYPVLGHGRGRLAAQKIKMAMAVHGKNRHYHWKEIRARHWMETAKRCGFGDMRQTMEETVERTAEAVAGAAKLLPKHFPESIAEPIFKGVAGRARQLAEELAKRAPG